ncbi:FAD binding domain protein [Mytilinidion resinicola]|uniref:FAD binding domain protein n=1 Tax=Mytilinidion resinicola TaxID=574789 RepID=A0A6A6YVA5_9PEZI|nr:FAD binding domain protein [Mytilinidion resinicola]KAF2812721.1 FAD binding domain protein [Mytilinidion resinicola]
MESASAKGDYLNILIVGAGIGGLTAAIALRKQGHDVQVFEQSALARETGAAIHLAPNANGILRRLGIFAETFGANPMERVMKYSATGDTERSMDLRETNKMSSQSFLLTCLQPWLLAHRIELHNQLKSAATNPHATGKPVTLRLSSKVIDIQPTTASITLEDGSQFHGDVVLGADGVHSVARKQVPGGNVEPFSCGKSAYRFLVPKKAAQADPATRQFVETPGELSIWYAEDRRIIMYPTSKNSVLNFVCVHPESESAAESGDGWDQTGDRDRMLQIYSSFDPAVRALIGKVDPKTVNVWTLLDMKVIPSWTYERLALLGDAAHPFLPHQGQGAGVAIEDAASLAVLFPHGTPREEVADRLKLYREIRYERANRIQEFSRMIGESRGKNKLDMYGFSHYNFGHDEWDNSTQKLREWTWKRNADVYWRMPIAFGPMPGPRQTVYGVARDSTQSTFTTASIKFKTSRTLLQNLFPPGRSGWSFKSPGTVAYASISQTTLNKMEWLGGSGYKHIGLYIHGVEYEKKNKETISGSYLPLLFESLTDPIVSGREELGMPKLYTSVDVHRRQTSYRIKTGWEGATWGEFNLEGLQEVDSSSESGAISGERDDGILAYRYMPTVGRENKGKPAEEYTVFDASNDVTPKPKPQRFFKAAKATFKIDALDWEALPTLHHIISRLQELPVYEIVGAKVVEGVGVPDVSTARPVE